jgi:hypothetical protein
MLDIVTAVGFIGPVGNGRTQPCRLECERGNGDIIEVVAKFSASTMEREKNLLIEAIAAMLAADLGLPIPKHFVVRIPPAFVDILGAWPEVQHRIRSSCPLAYGTEHLPSGFSVWAKGQTVPEELSVQAAEIFTFDGIIVNNDRRPDFPNCLFSGSALAIIDHELSLAPHQLLGWREPWSNGGFSWYASPDGHIFAKPRLAHCPDDLDRFIAAWENLDASRFNEYFEAIPLEWQQPNPFRDNLIRYLMDVRSHIRDVVRESLGVLR